MNAPGTCALSWSPSIPICPNIAGSWPPDTTTWTAYWRTLVSVWKRRPPNARPTSSAKGGKRVESEAAYRAGLALQERLAADFPNVPRYAENLARSSVSLALLVREGGQAQASLDLYAKAITALQALLYTEPRLVEARE